MATETSHQASTYHREPLWHGQLAVVAAIVLQLILPARYLVAPRSIIMILEAILLLSLILTTPKETIFSSVSRKLNAVVLIALISLANIYGLQVIVTEIIHGGQIASGQELILTSLNIYITNIIIFGLWYWELDGGGPGKRLGRMIHERDFLFPQARAEMAPTHLKWRPTFVDYLYISSTNATTFGPTDSLPLSHRAKMLMLVQSIVSFVTVALVASKAISILS